jgi:aralkylamine N-acetyltransferase
MLMMEIKIFKTEKNKKSDLLKAYSLAGGYGDKKNIKRMISNSRVIGLAYHNKNIAGVGRVIGDGLRFSYIVDLFVLEKYRGLGIGKKLVQELAKSTKANFITLTNDPRDPGLKDFYAKAGFKESKGESVFEWLDK